MATLKYIQEDGQVRKWDLLVENESTNPSYGIELVFDIPTGLSLTGPLVDKSTAIDVSKGSFNSSENKWYIGKLDGGEKTGTTSFEFTVDDITQANPVDDTFIVTATITSRCQDTDSVDNDFELMLKVGEDCVEATITLSPPKTVNTGTDSSCSETFLITL